MPRGGRRRQPARRGGVAGFVDAFLSDRRRALLLLQDLGIITLSEDAGLEATKNDIVDNPHNIDLQEMEAAMLPQTIDEVDFSIINSNYALQAGLDPTTDALASEDTQSDAAQLTPTSSP